MPTYSSQGTLNAYSFRINFIPHPQDFIDLFVPDFYADVDATPYNSSHDSSTVMESNASMSPK